MPHHPDAVTRLQRLTEALVVVTAVVAAVVFWHVPQGFDLPVVALFAGLVVISENVALHFPNQIAISPQLILVMAAVVATHGRGTVATALIIGASGGLVWRSIRLRRHLVIVFNICQMGLSAAGAAAVFDALRHSGVSPAGAAPVTVLTYMAINYGLVTPAAALRTGQRVRTVLTDMRISVINDLVFGILGLLLGYLYRSAGPVALVAIVAPAVVARTVFLSLAQFRQAYHRLDVLYAFTKHLERSRDQADAIATMLDRLRSLLQVDAAEVVLFDTEGWQRTSLRGFRASPVTTSGPGRPSEVDAVADGPCLVFAAGPDDRARADLERRGYHDGIVAPLLSDGQLIGAIVVANPSNNRRLTADDLRLLETLAHHAAVSLENTRLLDRLRFDSRHDDLTGLPNRTRFSELVNTLRPPGAILLVDLDRFKEVNDTLGHADGDRLLCSVADRISDELGHRGTVARMGGDEFAVLLPSVGTGDAAQAAVNLLAALEQPFHVGGLQLELTASIGVAVAQTAEDDVGKLLQQADVAMYAAKEAHSGWEAYSPDRDHYSPLRLALAGELRRAIDRHELEVHYQPKADLRTGAVCGLEALVRWRHPRYGLIGPDQFVPVAEHAGLIRLLTLMVLETTARQHRELRAMGLDLGIAINLSVRSVLDVNLPDQIAEVLARQEMSPSALTLEITESSVMADPARTIGILGRLVALGTAISIDDFGTGYSSLAYLKRLPASEVKIDRSFVAGLLNNDSDAAIVQSTVDLARNLGLRAVAEGVEDGQTWARLAEMGCEQAQGYFISPALPAPDLRRWLLRTQRVINPLA